MALDPADYPLTGGGPPKDLFTWPAVLDNRNVEGATAVAVPGVVSGMGLAHAEYGRMPWRDLLAPAVTLAKEGLLVDWFSTLLTTSVARSLAADPDAARMFLDDGTWPISGGWTAVCDRHLDQSAMAVTLEQLARNGPREFYEGEVARALVRDLRAKGSRMAEADLAGYQARIVDAQTVPYRDGRIYVAPGLTGGPTLAQALGILEPSWRPRAARPVPRATWPMRARSTRPSTRASRAWATPPASPRPHTRRPAPRISASSTATATCARSRRRCCRSSARAWCRRPPGCC